MAVAFTENPKEELKEISQEFEMLESIINKCVPLAIVKVELPRKIKAVVFEGELSDEFVPQIIEDKKVRLFEFSDAEHIPSKYVPIFAAALSLGQPNNIMTALLGGTRRLSDTIEAICLRKANEPKKTTRK